MAPLTAAAARCGRAARVTGEGAAVDRVCAILQARGFDTSPPASCEAAVVSIHSRQQTIEIHATLTGGKTVTRRVYQARTAAALIESWTVGDVSLEPKQAPGPDRDDSKDDPPEQPVRPRPDPAAMVTGPAAAPARPRLSVHVVASAALDTDTSTWLVGDIGACVYFEPLCAGVNVRGLFDTAKSGLSRRLHSSRAGGDILLTTAWPVDLDWARLVPALGAGAGWVHSGAQVVDESEQIEVDTGGLRLTVSTRVEMALGTATRLEVGVAVDASPLVKSTTLHTEGVDIAGQPKLTLRATVGIGWSN